VTGEERLADLRRLVAEAQGAGDETLRAAVLARLQRVSFLALQEAVGRASQDGASWRDLSVVLGMARTTLRRQYQAGGGVVAVGALPDGPAGPASGDDGAPHGPAGEVAGAAVMPVRLDRFVGREGELADLRGLLRRSRLVTVTGPGGVVSAALVAKVLVMAVA
jgi:hypothetical protein